LRLSLKETTSVRPHRIEGIRAAPPGVPRTAFLSHGNRVPEQDPFVYPIEAGSGLPKYSDHF